MAHDNVFVAKETLLQKHKKPQPTCAAPFISLIVHSLIQNALTESQGFLFPVTISGNVKRIISPVANIRLDR
jgi:hypothetical protein